MDQNLMSRRDFLKVCTFGILGMFAVLKLGSVSSMISGVSEERSDRTILRSNIAPSNHSVMWLNTGAGVNAFGVKGRSVPAGTLCYWDEEGDGWRPTTSTWS